jgi:pilus assembly protein CpaF
MEKMSQILSRVAQLVRAEAALNPIGIDAVFNKAIDAEVELGDARLNLEQEIELRRSAENQIFGFGKLQPLLEAEDIEEIWINSDSQVFVSERGLNRQIQLQFMPGELSGLIERMLRPVGRRLDRSSPFVDATLPGGSRLHVVIPDITRQNWSVNIRKFPKKIRTMDDLVSAGMVSPRQAEILGEAMRGQKNILVSGATQAGKTTLLSALLDCANRGDRIISVEETFELRAPQVDWVAMQTRQPNLEGIGEVSLRRLIKEALRMRPTRLVVGEVREAEALDLLIALNSGLPGICTIHSNSAESALLKLSTLPLLAGQNISMEFIKPAISSCIDYVVHCELLANGSRRIAEIRRLLPFDGSIRSESLC